MWIEKSELLRTWLANYLKPRCDADPGALAKYVVAIISKDASESELREQLLVELKIFLNSNIYEFIHTLFAVLASKEYENPIPETKETNQGDGCLLSACQALETLKTEIASFKEIQIMNSETIKTLISEKDELEDCIAEKDDKLKRIKEVEIESLTLSLETKRKELLLLETRLSNEVEKRKEKDAEIINLCVEVKLIANQAALLATGFEMNHLELEEVKEKVEQTFNDIENATNAIDDPSMLYRKERNELEKENVWQKKGLKVFEQMKNKPKITPIGYTMKEIKKQFQDKCLDMDAKIAALAMYPKESESPRPLKRKVSWELSEEEENNSSGSGKGSSDEGSPKTPQFLETQED